mgnify:CR=1 FL=1
MNFPKQHSNLDIAIKLAIMSLLIIACVLGSISKVQAQNYPTCNTPCEIGDNSIEVINPTICNNQQIVNISNYSYCNFTGIQFKWLIINRDYNYSDTIGIDNPKLRLSLPIGNYRICRLIYDSNGTHISTSSEVDVSVIDCTNIPCVYIDTMTVVIYDTLDEHSFVYDTITTELYDTIVTNITEHCIEETTLVGETNTDLCLFSVYPNPAYDCIYFDLFYYVSGAETTMQIIDNKGQHYYHGIPVDTICLESGIYFVVLDVEYNGKDYRYTRKFIIL